MNAWDKYGRAFVAVAIAGGTVAWSALTDARVDQGEAIQIAIAIVTAFGVWFVPNLPRRKGIKVGIAAVLAVLNLAVSLIVDGLTTQEIINLVLAALGVAGVGAAPSTSTGELTRPAPLP